MEKRQLGNSDLLITPIGIGAWAMGGGGWAYAWGPQDDQDSINAIHAGLDQGINWIDTAAVYGLGHSEETVAAALKGCSARLMYSPNASWCGMRKGRSANALRRIQSAGNARPAFAGCKWT